MDKEIKILVFTVNDEYYAADIGEVERIIGYEKPTKLPDTPSFTEGVINHEGHILAVVNLAKRFKLPENSGANDKKIIVVKGENEQDSVGIIVDLVSEVKDVLESSIELPKESISGISRRYIKGLIKFENKILIFLNMGSILTDEEKEELMQ
ncbi:chemotaxis protein CheW [Clostridium oryzae]|uniref:Chemotaxis protein CheW n=1 Tax=Clostridium oryzae TaxID=1450648 RepID=A0A1V4ILF2_9CLOT|nr:chemotaxis protein CheW [Clostridium oryzae]OPJ60861.1 chemotaxis protein CheW [Clostridium oryzae]